MEIVSDQRRNTPGYLRNVNPAFWAGEENRCVLISIRTFLIFLNDPGEDEEIIMR